jgi:hypothetical protein
MEFCGASIKNETQRQLTADKSADIVPRVKWRMRMEKPLAVRLTSSDSTKTYRVSIDPAIIRQHHFTASHSRPALLVVRKATILNDIAAGLIDSTDIVSVQDGNWDAAVLVVLPPAATTDKDKLLPSQSDDKEFIASVRRNAPGLADLAVQTISAIRAAGVNGKLTERAGGRWVNNPLNTFTLKAQPRAENLAFTLYGNPETYSAQGFLLKDQNSYSRGWVRSLSDIGILADLVRQSHARRMR